MNNEIEFILASDVRIPGERTYSGHDMILSTGERVTLSSSGNSFYLKAANGSVFQMNASTAGSLLNACSSSCNTNNSFGNLQNNCNNINSTPNGVATTSQLFGVGGSASSPSINYRNHTPHVQNLQQSNNPSNMQPPFSAINTVQPHGQSLPQWSNSNCPPQSILNTRQNRRIEPSPSVAKDNSTSTFRHQSGPGMPTNDAPTSSEVIELSDSSEETEWWKLLKHNNMTSWNDFRGVRLIESSPKINEFNIHYHAYTFQFVITDLTVNTSEVLRGIFILEHCQLAITAWRNFQNFNFVI